MNRYVLPLIVAVGLLAGPMALVGLAEATGERRQDQWSQWGRPHPDREHHWNGHRWHHHHQWKRVVPATQPVWQPGYWYWNGWAWEWVPGHWVR